MGTNQNVAADCTLQKPVSCVRGREGKPWGGGGELKIDTAYRRVLLLQERDKQARHNADDSDGHAIS